MAHLFFSMAGEGRGHAARAKAVVDGLKERHRITLLTPDDAWEFLGPIYRDDPAVTVEQIPGPRFRYTPKGRVSVLGTAWSNAGYALRLRSLVAPTAAAHRGGAAGPGDQRFRAGAGPGPPAGPGSPTCISITRTSCWCSICRTCRPGCSGGPG